MTHKRMLYGPLSFLLGFQLLSRFLFRLSRVFIHTCTHRRTHARTHARTHTHPPAHTHTHSLSLSLSHTHTESDRSFFPPNCECRYARRRNSYCKCFHTQREVSDLVQTWQPQTYSVVTELDWFSECDTHSDQVRRPSVAQPRHVGQLATFR